MPVIIRSFRSLRRPTRNVRITTCGDSGATCHAPAASRSSIAAGTAVCWSNGSRASRPKPNGCAAYGEINHFEEQLVNHGILLVKFWIHISKDGAAAALQGSERHQLQAMEDHR